MTPIAPTVSAPIITIAFFGVAGIPMGGRINSAGNRAAIQFNPDVDAILTAPQRGAPAPPEVALSKLVRDEHSKNRCTEPTEPPTVRRVVAEQTNPLLPLGHHV